jgi:hypothetical protein
MNSNTCYSCGKNGLKHRVRQDFRQRDGQTAKYASCETCCNLNDDQYFAQAERTYELEIAQTHLKGDKKGCVIIVVERKGITSKELYDAVNKSLDNNEICPDDSEIEITIKEGTILTRWNEFIDRIEKQKESLLKK